MATGLRRGELLAIRLLVDIDLDAGKVEVRRSLEETKAGLRFKEPKTEHGRRTLSLPPSAITVLREHRKALLETRLALGLGKPDDTTLLFSEPDGHAHAAQSAQLAVALRLQGAQVPEGVFPRAAPHPRVGADRRRLGRGGREPAHRPRQPDLSLNTYGHLFKKDDSAAVAAIEAALRTRSER
jgi:integrase